MRYGFIGDLVRNNNCQLPDHKNMIFSFFTPSGPEGREYPPVSIKHPKEVYTAILTFFGVLDVGIIVKEQISPLCHAYTVASELVSVIAVQMPYCGICI